MKYRTKLILILIFALALAAGSFGVGFLTGSSSQLVSAQSGSIRSTDQLSQRPAEFDLFWEAWEIVHENFVDQDVLDPTALTYGAIEGMLEALGDQGHTGFLTPDELSDQREDISGTYKGIGASLGVRDSLPIIVTPFDGSPAEAAGVKAGDIILAIDDEDATDLDLNEIVDRIRGPEDTEVTLTLLRVDGEDTDSLDITITRGEIEIPAVTWAMVPETNVALIRLSQFSANATDNLQEAVGAAEAAGAEAIVLDIRNNPGGLLDQAIRVTSQFIGRGRAMQEEDAQGRRRAYRVRRGGVATEIPMVALINAGTVSSAEILAGALQDHERAQLIGVTTFGTGTVLEPFLLEDGSAIMLGTRQWLTADGRLIRKKGIEPDIEIDLSIGTDLMTTRVLGELALDEVLESEDLQFLKALELLKAIPEGTVVLPENEIPFTDDE